VEDRFGGAIPPEGALAEIFAVDGQDTTLLFGRTSNLAENPFTLSFLNCVIPTDSSRSIAIFGRIADVPQTGFFQINIPSGEHVNARDPNSHNSVSVMDATGEDWAPSGLRSDPKDIRTWNRIGSSEQSESFSPSKGPTKIQYYLEKNSTSHSVTRWWAGSSGLFHSIHRIRTPLRECTLCSGMTHRQDSAGDERRVSSVHGKRWMGK
jgi:hypothetical protein